MGYKKIVTSRTLFHFKDGSINDETTVFGKRHTFQLISDHRSQKGSSFSSMDILALLDAVGNI